MGQTPPDYDHLRIGKLRHLASQGDPKAFSVAERFRAQLVPEMQKMQRLIEDGPSIIAGQINADHERQMAELERAANEIAEERARKEEAAIERERQMLATMREMAEAAARAEQRERASEARAVEAEDRQAKMVKLTTGSLILAALAVLVQVLPG